MKTKKLVPFFAVMFLLFTACEKEDTNPYGKGNGQTTFWISVHDTALGSISVSIDNQHVGTIAHYYTSVWGPDCGKADVNPISSAGIHNLYAVANNGHVWAGAFTVVESKCDAIQLTP